MKAEDNGKSSYDQVIDELAELLNGKSSYDQVIDELAELLRERKNNKALSFWDKLSDRVSTTESSYNSGKNPVSNKDSVGSGEKQGALTYNGMKYDIYYPNMSNKDYIEPIWKLEDTISIEIPKFDWLKFLATLGLEDYENKNYAFNSLAGLSGIISSANHSIERTYLTINLYALKTGKRRASIAVTTDGAKKIYASASAFNGTLASSTEVEDKLGKSVEDGLYWIYANISDTHLYNDATGYLWFDDSNLMYKPYILPDDNIFAKKLSLQSDSKTYKLPVSSESTPVDSVLIDAIMEKLKQNNIFIN